MTDKANQDQGNQGWTIPEGIAKSTIAIHKDGSINIETSPKLIAALKDGAGSMGQDDLTIAILNRRKGPWIHIRDAGEIVDLTILAQRNIDRAGDDREGKAFTRNARNFVRRINAFADHLEGIAGE